MTIALITTTINVPRVLALYRGLDGVVPFFIVADEKTPTDAYKFCADLPLCEIYSPDRQRELGYACSGLIGWNTDSRRNIALLEAVKSGADFIVSVDDDMIPFGGNFFDEINRVLGGPVAGLCFSGDGWFDAGYLTMPQAKQRGLPARFDAMVAPSFVHNVQVGAMQGTILGVPDTDACTTITSRPIIHSATDILKEGFVVDPQTHAVFNSQITAFRRELAPCFAQFYAHQGRNTDIIASLIMRRVMVERDLYTHFGPPTGFHARADRHPLKDLEAEMTGLRSIEKIQKSLDAWVYGGNSKSASTVDIVRDMWKETALADDTACLYEATVFLDDMERVL